ncbi:methyl-accepting chemotaxis protein [Geofilum rubicundum]|uniref:Two-component sensor n=1 Tax=Geofilum rubicundum JCM 15548 TaxID=1236989 RepID=A0A0E9LVM1_9BACT|nr:PAS domain-containing protein [Geofilum rubicundum]GAO29304.1 two-component sensor [Geofilum rubicundum JCM 15548]
MTIFAITASLFSFLAGYLLSRKIHQPPLKVELSTSDTDIKQPDLKTDESAHPGMSTKEMERLSIVAKQTENAIMIMDADGYIEWVNEGFTRMYGYTYEEFTQTLGSHIRQTSFSDAIEERLYKVQKMGQPVFYEALNITRDGKSIWTHTSLTPIFNDAGELTYLAAIDSDISRRKESSDVLLQTIGQLSHSINELSSKQQHLLNETANMMQSVKDAGELLEETTSITRFIKDISDKIKILGLNASIESANFNYSGIQNRTDTNGFRVISNEIIQLSEDSKKQTNRISNTMLHLENSFSHLNKNKESFNHFSDAFFTTLNDVRKELIRVERVAEQLNT